jgi:hypothetical protein
MGNLLGRKVNRKPAQPGVASCFDLSRQAGLSGWQSGLALRLNLWKEIT